jgi:hypothetical protein
MIMLPIIERELRVALRKKRPVRSRLAVAAAGGGIALLFVWLGTKPGTRGLGGLLHRVFCTFGLYLALRPPLRAAGMIAEERRNQTLGLLFLSGLSPAEVFASKVLSGALIALTQLLALFPLLASPFLIGGVSFDLFLATVCCLPNILLFALSVSLLASVLTREEGAAVLLAAVLGLGLCVAAPALYSAQVHLLAGARPSLWWLRLSPAYGPYLVWTGLQWAPIAEFWRNLGLTVIWSGLCLGAAALALRGLSRRGEDACTDNRWRELWSRLVHGGAAWRGRLAARWLEANPFVWLAARDRQPVALAWAIAAGTVAAWGLSLAVSRGVPSQITVFLLALFLNGTLRWLLHYTAARGLGEARCDGTYELLLTTPLQPRDIVCGQIEALNWQFRTVRRVALLLTTSMLIEGVALLPGIPAVTVCFIMAWCWLLAWGFAWTWRARSTLLVMWAGLNCGRAAVAVWRATGLQSWLLSKGETPDYWEGRLTAELREIAREALPDLDDPRFKRWDVRERFPWGWLILQQQLHERLARRR